MNFSDFTKFFFLKEIYLSNVFLDGWSWKGSFLGLYNHFPISCTQSDHRWNQCTTVHDPGCFQEHPPMVLKELCTYCGQIWYFEMPIFLVKIKNFLARSPLIRSGSNLAEIMLQHQGTFPPSFSPFGKTVVIKFWKMFHAHTNDLTVLTKKKYFLFSSDKIYFSVNSFHGKLNGRIKLKVVQNRSTKNNTDKSRFASAFFVLVDKRQN